MTIPIEKALATAWLVPLGDPKSNYCIWGLNLMLWGEPGIGKSERIDMAAAMAGLPPRTVYAATTQPEDVSGAAFPNTTKAVAMVETALESLDAFLESKEESIAKSWLGRIAGASLHNGVKKVLGAARKYGKTTTSMEPLLPGITDLMVDQQGVLFLDELSCARPAVQGAYLGVVLNRRVGGKKLPPGVRVVAAANPPESAAGGWELEAPMANRFCHIDMQTPTVEEWTEWLINEEGAKIEPIENGEQTIRARWPDEWPISKGQIAGFMKSKGTDSKILHNMPKEGSKNRGKAWASPRSWAMAVRAITACRCLNMDDTVRDVLLEGCVGAGPATEFVTWIKKANLPSPQDMIQNGWTPDKRELDRTIAAYVGMVSYIKERSNQKEKVDLGPGAWKCLTQAADAGLLDIVLPYAMRLVRSGVDSKSSPQVADAAKPLLARLAKGGYSQFLTDQE